MVKLHAYLTDRGFTPNVNILDKKYPDALKRHLLSNRMTFQLVPPYLDHNNMAEHAIGTFKDHLIAGIFNIDPSFPIHLWCCLTRLATTTLNLLHSSAINPRISAEAQTELSTTSWRRWWCQALMLWFTKHLACNAPCYHAALIAGTSVMQLTTTTTTRFMWTRPAPSASYERLNCSQYLFNTYHIFGR